MQGDPKGESLGLRGSGSGLSDGGSEDSVFVAVELQPLPPGGSAAQGLSKKQSEGMNGHKVEEQKGSKDEGVGGGVEGFVVEGIQLKNGEGKGAEELGAEGLASSGAEEHGGQGAEGFGKQVVSQAENGLRAEGLNGLNGVTGHGMEALKLNGNGFHGAEGLSANWREDVGAEVPGANGNGAHATEPLTLNAIEGLVAVEPTTHLRTEHSITKNFDATEFWARKKSKITVAKRQIPHQPAPKPDEPVVHSLVRQLSHEDDTLRRSTSSFQSTVSVATQNLNRMKQDPNARTWKRAVWVRLSASVLSMVFAWIGVLYPTSLLDQQIELVNDSKDLLMHQRLIDDVRFYDEILTSSARMCKHDGSPVFLDYYDAAVPLMDSTLAALNELRPQLASQFEATTVYANDMLIEMETVALQGCESGTGTEAVDLESDAYEEHKATLGKGLLMQRKDLQDEKIKYKEKVFSEMDDVWNAIYVCTSLFSTFFGLLVAAGAYVDMNQERWMRSAKENALSRGDIAKEDEALAFWSKNQLFIMPGVVVMVFISILVPFGLNHSALSLRRMGDDLIDLQAAVGDLKYYDAVLTNSARMCAMTGEMRWKVRYLQGVDQMDSAIEEIAKIEGLLKQNYDAIARSNWAYGDAFSASVAAVNEKLVDSEMTVISRCASQGGSDDYEKGLLFNNNYLSTKDQFRKEIEDLESAVKASTEGQIDSNNEKIKNSYKTGAGLLCAMQFFNGVLFIFLVYRIDNLKFCTKVFSASKLSTSIFGNSFQKE